MTKKIKRAPGGGRKKLPYKTTTVRIPTAVKPEVQKIVHNFKNKMVPKKVTKTYSGNRPLEDIKRDVLKAKGYWHDLNFKGGGDYVSFGYKGRNIAYNPLNGTFIVRAEAKTEKFNGLVTERSIEMDGTPWYDELLNLLYTRYHQGEKAGA